MPELPEVETVVRTLEKQIKGRRIESVNVRYEKIVSQEVPTFIENLVGQCFRGFGRRGKYLLLQMDTCVLVCHLRMEGKFYILDSQEPCDRHTHVVFTLDNGQTLRYHDTRKFGRMETVPLGTDFSHWHGLGPEPFDDAFDSTYIQKIAQKRSTPLKSLLLDQSFVAGIGNIYADEILAACHLRPGRSCKRTTHTDAENIAMETRRILNEAIKAGGTTIRSYTSSLGVTGMFQLNCVVHAKKTCGLCGSETKVRCIGGRSSYYCPSCQK